MAAESSFVLAKKNDASNKSPAMRDKMEKIEKKKREQEEDEDEGIYRYIELFKWQKNEEDGERR